MFDFTLSMVSDKKNQRNSTKRRRSALSVVSDFNSMETVNSATQFSSKSMPHSGPKQQKTGKSKPTKKPTYKHVPHSKKPVHLVAKRNERERKRVQAVNSAFLQLRKHVPHEPRHKRLSKFKTLKVAIQYIHHMQDLIQAHDKQKNNSRLYDTNYHRSTRSCQANNFKASPLSSFSHPSCLVQHNLDNSKINVPSTNNDISNFNSCGKREDRLLTPLQHQRDFPDHRYHPNGRNLSNKICTKNEDFNPIIDQSEQMHCTPAYSHPDMFPISDSFTNVASQSHSSFKHSDITHYDSSVPLHQAPYHSRYTWPAPVNNSNNNNSHPHQHGSVPFTFAEIRGNSTTPDSMSSLDSWNSGIPGNFPYASFHENIVTPPCDSHSPFSSSSTSLIWNDSVVGCGGQ